MDGGNDSLSDNEGALLCEIMREQPVTAYQLVRAYERSPVGRFNKSKGQIYPLIRRLRQRGLIEASSVAGDKRGTEQLALTGLGRAALRLWAQDVRDHHTLLEDPLRTKMLAFEVLDEAEILAWVSRAQAALREKRAELERYDATVTAPYRALIYANAVLSLESRIEWLEQVRKALIEK
ncbi:MAG: PadR family transcriptional regulator [Novosphingobium sp.]|uniref:PadR family transcriptional regulator n=1 Tax=Novosphingobium sp. TaxID=1874826 RepID=UPI001D988596|nr:PadR family transcriptional regulator [Novosphingobium sp.]MCB2056550.1 PadR family transcriptional regulator [Novosphingobium sp.]MCP5386282.1 PadR family transcriptional regulator [Novosphingobium sp.]